MGNFQKKLQNDMLQQIVKVLVKHLKNKITDEAIQDIAAEINRDFVFPMSGATETTLIALKNSIDYMEDNGIATDEILDYRKKVEAIICSIDESFGVTPEKADNMKQLPEKTDEARDEYGLIKDSDNYYNCRIQFIKNDLDKATSSNADQNTIDVLLDKLRITQSQQSEHEAKERIN